MVKLLCGTRTRAGVPCQRHPMRNGHCRLHGGLSTGPRTPEGKVRSIVALIVSSIEFLFRSRKRALDES